MPYLSLFHLAAVDPGSISRMKENRSNDHNRDLSKSSGFGESLHTIKSYFLLCKVSQFIVRIIQ